jgi:carbon storage regulator
MSGLVLTRRVGERIVIDGDIFVEVAAIQGGKVRLRIVAPDDVEIDREEIAERKAKERQNAHG